VILQGREGARLIESRQARSFAAAALDVLGFHAYAILQGFTRIGKLYVLIADVPKGSRYWRTSRNHARPAAQVLNWPATACAGRRPE
jgi:hypothetical protein